MKCINNLIVNNKFKYDCMFFECIPIMFYQKMVYNNVFFDIFRIIQDSFHLKPNKYRNSFFQQYKDNY